MNEKELRRQVVKLAYEKRELRPHLLPLLVKTADKSFEESVKDKRFTNPETGNEVKFKSLPSEEQKKIREKWKEKNEGGEGNKKDEDDSEGGGDGKKSKFEELSKKHGDEPISFSSTESEDAIAGFDAVLNLVEGDLSEALKDDENNEIAQTINALRADESPKVKDVVKAVNKIDEVVRGRDELDNEAVNHLKDVQESLVNGLERGVKSL